ncbi:DUF4381 family protein [Archangium primigenium]|uniref:DUF4381 family protein n=1 Tax=[Archangium] primigenium TaxID=2792470 RepID=UPI0019586ADC|nr:DUF4381 family protein [Archangium primigenium]MBM7114241.1 DUF4381 family protein [Archangium primigenium]
MKGWVLCALLAASPVWAQAPAAPAAAPASATLPEAMPADVRARVEPERVLLGEPFVYELAITHPAQQRYELELPADLGDFEVISQERTPPESGKEPAVTTFRLRMSAFKLGTVTLPEVPFAVSTPEGPHRYVAPGRTLEVGSTLPDDAQTKGEDLRDIQPPTEVAIRSLTLVWVLLGAIAAALLGVVAWRAFQKYRERKLAAVAPPLPLDVRTRRALDALKTEDLPARGQVKDFYFRLSEILRGYLGERYGFDALECTSSELMTRLRGLHAPGLPEDGLMRFISESDMVKYARADASADSCQDALTFGYALLDKTWPPLLPPVAADVSHASGPRVS